ncbi:hypothetical protein RclHR1_06020004 [Rhizophagus clarus]|uniref:Uncharacterized protein n=1 Tax=Rhizophagus clarus TaxID=94130 RepID=A0A2Z6SHN2_9GLOM|nr:hypothetical protein RclHR1_06020004 [Rhizophagus clarus]GET04013.1 hypothetical protein GLOIN_2v1822239 [Rhizophagus clarus]
MDNNPLQNNHDGRTFSESNNLQQSIANVIQPEHEHFVYNAVSDFSAVNNNNIFQTTHMNSNYTHQPSNENTTSVSSLYVPQYHDRPQPIENTTSTLGSLNMTTINPSQSEIFSFDIPGFKIIIVPTFPQQDNHYSNYSSSDITGNQFTQFTQFQG